MFCRPFGAYYCSATLSRGGSPPSVVFRAFGAYLADSNNRIYKLVNNTLSMSLSPLLSLSLLHYRRFFASLKCRRTSLPSVLFLFFETLGKPPRTGIRQKHRWKGASSHTPRSIGSHSTEHRLTLHGASAHAPRSIGLRSTEHRKMPQAACLKSVAIYDNPRVHRCASGIA